MLIIFLILFIFFFSPIKIQAQIVIDEVMANPNPGESEWVKFFNPSSENITLAGWLVEDELASPSLIYSFSEEAQISGQDFLTINIANKLNNTGDGVVLKNNLGLIVDQISYESSIQGVSWRRQTSVSPVPSPTPDVSSSPSPTPTLSPNFTPIPTLTPTPTPSPQASNHNFQLKISEIMSCPIAPNPEWIEIENLSNQPVYLENFFIKDQNSNQLSFNLELGALESSKVELERNILNNTGDKLYLLTSDEDQLNFVEIPACEVKGESFINQDGGWQQLSQLKKLGASPTPVVSPTPDISGIGTDEATVSSGLVLGTKSYYNKNYYQVLSLGDEASDGANLVAGRILKINAPQLAKVPTIFVIIGGTFLMFGAVIFFQVYHSYAQVFKKNPILDRSLSAF